jgi:hypothetical protein
VVQCGTLKTDRTDQLPSHTEGQTPSSIYRRNTSQRSTRQPALSQAIGDRPSSTGLPSSFQANSQGQYSPAESRHGFTDTRSMFGQQGLPPRDMTVSRDGDPTHPTLTTDTLWQSGMERAQRPELLEKPEMLDLNASVGGDGRALNEVVVELDSESDYGRPDQYVVVVTDPISIQGHGRSRPPSPQPSVTPSRPSRKDSVRPTQAESPHKCQAPSLSLDANNDPQQSQLLDDPTMAEYPGASRPAWYVPSGPDSSSAYQATSHIRKQPQGHYYPPTRDVTLAPSYEPRLSVAERVTRFDQGSLAPPGPPSHTHRSLSKAPQQNWTGAPTHQPRPNGIPSEIPPGPRLERSVSRKGDRRPISTAGLASGTPRMPSVSHGTQSVPEQRSNVQRPPPKQYRRQSPLSDSERSLRSAMDLIIDRQPQAHPRPSRHARDQPPLSRRRDISRGKSSAVSSRRPEATVGPQDDPLAGDGSDSSSSMSSAALERHDPEFISKGRKLPQPGTRGTLTPESRTETTSRHSPPSIFVVPADTPSPPPSSLGGTDGRPSTSVVDSQPTVQPTTINKNASPRSAQKQIYSEGIQQSASRRSENSRRRLNEPSQNHQTSRTQLDPDHRGPEPSLKRLNVPGRRSALPGLSRIGSSGSLRDQAQAAELSSEGENSEITSGYFTENDDDRTSDYSDDNDGSFDERTRGPSSVQRSQIPQNARGDPRSRQARHVEDDRPPVASKRPARPAPRLGVETREPSPRPPPQQHPVDGVPTSENGHVERGRRRSRSRSRMPGGFPGDLESSTPLTM